MKIIVYMFASILLAVGCGLATLHVAANDALVPTMGENVIEASEIIITP